MGEDLVVTGDHFADLVEHEVEKCSYLEPTSIELGVLKTRWVFKIKQSAFLFGFFLGLEPSN